MTIHLDISQSEATKHEFAKVTLNCTETGNRGVLDVEFSPLYRRFGIPSAIALDYLFLASAVYAVDKLVPRAAAIDSWTRELELDVPVSQPELWGRVAEQLEVCLSFLTGDHWRLRFSQLRCELHRPSRRRRYDRSHPEADAVCLFSGGLDSLIGAIDWLEQQQGKLLLVGHHDQYGGPLSDQKALFQALEPHYPSRVELFQVRVGQTPSGPETTFRSRSLLFLALGMYAASALGERTPLWMPENGTIAINVPLTPSRRGSCSTRTAHPFFLNTLKDVLSQIIIQNPLINPLAFKTKGEAVTECRNQPLLHQLALKSVSCAKRGHKRTWLNREASGCGRCMPCIYRRASLHKVGLDMEEYGRDVCVGDVRPDSDGALADDFRALISFLRRNLSAEQVASLLLSNGPIVLDELPGYAELVLRAMSEVQALFADKGSDHIKQQVGIED